MFTTGCSIEQTNQEPVIYEGIVQEKYFQKGTVSTGVGVTTSGRQVVTTESTSDEYIIFVNDKDYTVSKDVWLNLEKGTKIRYQLGLFGIKNIVIIDSEENHSLNKNLTEGELEQ